MWYEVKTNPNQKMKTKKKITKKSKNVKNVKPAGQ